CSAAVIDSHLHRPDDSAPQQRDQRGGDGEPLQHRHAQDRRRNRGRRVSLTGVMAVVRVRNVRRHGRSSRLVSGICYNVTSTSVQPVARYAVAPHGLDFAHTSSGLRSLAPRSRPRTCNMSEQRPRVVAVGEVLIEFVRGGGGRFGIGWGGGNFNVAGYLARPGVPFMVAVYLAGAGIDAAFATALGDDSYSEAILALAAAEGVASDLVLRTRGRLPGLAVVDADAAGARRRYDWGADAPARDLFELPDWGRVAEGLTKAKLVYFSGITLSLYSNTGLGRFLALIEMVRQQGVKVAFDGNFRPRGWRGDLSRTRTVFMEALKRVDMALPAYDDEAV